MLPTAADPSRTNGGDRLAIGVYPGRPFSYGVPVVYNHSDGPLTLEAVDLVDATPGLELLAPYALSDRVATSMATASICLPAMKAGRRTPSRGCAPCVRLGASRLCR